MINDRTRLSFVRLSACLCVSLTFLAHGCCWRFRQVTLISSVCLVVCLPCTLTSTVDVFAAGDAFCAPSLTRPPGAHFASRRSTPAAAVRLNKNDIEEPPVFGSIKDLEGELLRYARRNSLSPSRVSLEVMSLKDLNACYGRKQAKSFSLAPSHSTPHIGTQYDIRTALPDWNWRGRGT